MSQTLQSVLCITNNKYLVRVLVVLLHARFGVVGPIPFLLAAIFLGGHPYNINIGKYGSTSYNIGSTTYRKYYRTSRYLYMLCAKYKFMGCHLSEN